MAWPAVLLPLLAVGASASAVAGASTGTHALQPPGQFHGDEPVARDGERWLALRLDAGAARLAPAVLSVRPVEDLLLDAPGQRSGRLVSSPDADQVVAYVRGPALRAGTVHAATGGTGTPLAVHAPVAFAFDGRAWRLEARCEPTGPVDPGMPSLDCRLVLATDGREQALARMAGYRDAAGRPALGDDAAPRLLFAGDLDRDGRADVLVDLTDHYNVSRPTLFLSSQALPGALVGQVAQYQSVGC